jgi:hypothetical protein
MLKYKNILTIIGLKLSYLYYSNSCLFNFYLIFHFIIQNNLIYIQIILILIK